MRVLSPFAPASSELDHFLFSHLQSHENATEREGHVVGAAEN